MKDPFDRLIVTIFIAFITGHFISGAMMNNDWRRQAIKHGFADYNPTNGVWEWKGVE